MKLSALSPPALMIGLGIGAVGGVLLGNAAILLGIFAVVIGVAGLVFGSEPPTLTAATPVESAQEGPTLAGLGDRVASILRMAQEQAADHRAEAKRESDAILSAAHSEAQLILEQARAEAAGLTAAAKPETGPDSTGSAGTTLT